MNALRAAREIASVFGSHGIPDAEREAEHLVTGILAVDRVRLYTDAPPIPASAEKAISDAVQRRLCGEPLLYILGEADFLGLSYVVGPGVLIPRPETELLVEESTRLLAGSDDADVRSNLPGPIILDLCTGSGCVAISIALRFPSHLVIGSDRSICALRYARINAERHRPDNVGFVCGDLFSAFGRTLFDGITANPPYIPSKVIDTLQREISDYEPREALDGGADGLAYYRSILPAAPGFLRDGGFIALEIGNDQSAPLQGMAERAGFQDIAFLPDISGVPRIMTARAGRRRRS